MPPFDPKMFLATLAPGKNRTMLHTITADFSMRITEQSVAAVAVAKILSIRLFNSSEKRLARLLLLLAQFGKEGKPEPIIPKVSQETLAEMIGTTRSRVSFFMNKFCRLGFIEYNSGLSVNRSLLTVVLHD
jgi:CRP/FNR family cyclic AMP-dependent transcriptional regulator